MGNTIRIAIGLLLVSLALAACSGPAADKLDTDRQIARGVLDLLVSDHKPVCVERLSYGDPLQVYRSARRGELQRVYDLGWGEPGAFRPPEMPSQDELAEAVQQNRSAGLPDAPLQRPSLPREERSELDGLAYALSPSAVATRSVVVRQSWLPSGAHARWWPGSSTALGCRANYVLSSIKRNDHVAFMAVRVDHWATLYALTKVKGRWTPIAQWASWMY